MDCKIIAAEFGFRGFIAALNSLTLDSNGIFGKLLEIFGNGAEPDKFAADCDAFLAALKDSNITTLSLQKTGIGPVALRKLATSLPAALTSINCDGAHIDEYDFASLKSVAPEGCEVLWKRT